MSLIYIFIQIWMAYQSFLCSYQPTHQHKTVYSKNYAAVLLHLPPTMGIFSRWIMWFRFELLEITWVSYRIFTVKNLWGVLLFRNCVSEIWSLYQFFPKMKCQDHSVNYVQHKSLWVDFTFEMEKIVLLESLIDVRNVTRWRRYTYCWLVRGSLFIELGCPRDLGKGWRGDLGTFMISRPI